MFGEMRMDTGEVVTLGPDDALAPLFEDGVEAIDLDAYERCVQEINRDSAPAGITQDSALRIAHRLYMEW